MADREDEDRLEEAVRRAEEAARRAEEAAREAEEVAKEQTRRGGPGKEETYGHGRRDDD